MKKFKLISAISLFFIIVGFPSVSLSQSVSIHSIIAVTGKVTVKKPTWKNSQPASVGLTLQSEDTLFVPAKASIKVYCSNLQIREFKGGNHQVSSGCSTGNSVIQLPNSNNILLRGDDKTEEALAKLPYLITPRNTFILTNTPQLRWNAISGASSYTVSIDRVNWQEQTNNTEITYTGGTLLKTGRRYRVTIKADNGATSTDEAVVGFQVLDESTQQTVLEAVKTIEQQTLSPEEKGILLAKLYRGYKLYADAVEVLEELVTQESQEVTVYQLLGKTYLDTGLPQLAKGYYEKALDLANNSENIVLQADLASGLGIAYGNLGEKEKAVELLEKAKVIYEELGDKELSKELAETINLILERTSE